MTEMEWEDAPEVYVPRVRNWLGPALKDWARGCYPPRHGLFIVWGWLIPIWAMWAALKFFVYAAGVVLMLAAYLVWVLAELVTYRGRRKRVLLREYTRYVLDLHEQDPPPQAA